MCDTLGLLTGDCPSFLKNSDRSPNEPQVCEWIPAKTHTARTLKATTMELEQVKETHALLLSRPTWLWGGEMGVNDCGVCIGNEAVFTKGPYAKDGLLGMDMLRLALERSDTAKDALETILYLLERYGQGGNGGFDHTFYYDNSYLIMDRNTLYVLETAGKHWVYKRMVAASISNRLSIENDGDAYDGNEPYNFRKRQSDILYTHFSGSKNRLDQSSACLSTLNVTKNKLDALRVHDKRIASPLCENSVSSVCMHAGGLVGDHTTASMVVELNTDMTRVWLTGSSTPCISLFKPYALSNPPIKPVFSEHDADAKHYWLRRERFHRAMLGKTLPPEYYAERDDLENQWIRQAQNLDTNGMHALAQEAAKQEDAFYQAWEQRLPGGRSGKASFHAYWRKKNLALEASN